MGITWVRRSGSRGRPARRAPLSWWVVAAGVAVVVAVSWGATAWLLAEAAAAKDPGAARVDAVKTGLGIGAGTSGVLALLLAVRRQWHQEATAVDTTHDATERRVTELYAKAVEQLGSEKAPVRLGGLYALERLAQDHPAQRQTIVNVLCAYLRMPYAASDPPTAPDAPADLVAEHRERAQEREVRLAAQRILTHHLRPGDDPDRPSPTFWPATDLDLTGATLVDFDFRDRTAHDALFTGATFVGDADFSPATFTGVADFAGATFTGNAWFSFATFTGRTTFHDATFADQVWFSAATFTDDADFTDATFLGDALFADATFAEDAQFSGAAFSRKAVFILTAFAGDVWFRDTTFGETTQGGDMWTDFSDARFTGDPPREIAAFTAPPPDQDG